jgi:hypothetical protein
MNFFEPVMACVVAARAQDQAGMPELQFPQIQAGRVAPDRWVAPHVCAAAGAVHVLLATVLLVFIP